MRVHPSWPWLAPLIAAAVATACEGRPHEDGMSEVFEPPPPPPKRPRAEAPPATREPQSSMTDSGAPASDPLAPRDASSAGAPVARDAGADARPADAATTAQWQPVTPTGAVPNCRVASSSRLPTRDSRWIVARAQEATSAAYFVQISPDGLTKPAAAGPLKADSWLSGWSTDGQYFVFPPTEETFAPPWVQVVEPEGAALALAAPIAGRLLGFAPGRHSFVVSDLSLFKVYDADRLDLPPRKAPAPYGGVDNFSWSPDGRYLVLSMPNAVQPGLRRLALDLEPLELEAPFAETGTNIKWSPDARYLAFNRYLNNSMELWLADWTTGKARVRRIATGVNNGSGSFGNHQWLDATRLLWEELSRQVHVSSIEGDQLADRVLFSLAQAGYFAVSPGGACVAFTGDCSSASDPGVCVVSSGEPATRATVSRSASPSMLWHDTGALLANVPRSGKVVEVVNLDGTAFAPVLVTDGGDFDLLRGWRWAPNAAPWFAYTASAKEGRRRSVLYLWNADTGKTLTVEPEGLNLDSFAWSPDARYLVIAAHEPANQPTRAPLLVQRIDGEALGPRWTSDGPFFPFSESIDSLLVFQP